MDSVLKTVLEYPKLKERIEEKGISASKVGKLVNEIRADYSKTYVRSFEKLLDSTLPQLYDGINFNENGVDFKSLLEKKCVVLVPNHQSHADYVAMGYMIYKKYKVPLYVAGGNNLNIFPIGKLFRKSGCFFIRRSFQNDILYKLTLEGYLYYLLLNKKPIEFFFEGGRSRTGKLLPPRFGLYHMLLDAYYHLPDKARSGLVFIPVSINHEYIPEQRSLVLENRGAEKKKESTFQLVNLIKLFSHQFGSVHINLGQPVNIKKAPNVLSPSKKMTQDLAFDCFLEVGKNMVVTPSSLLAYILLDTPGKAMKWEEIEQFASRVIKYCDLFQVPLTESLNEQQWSYSLKRAMDIFIANKKVQLLGKNLDGPTYYGIGNEARGELLYFKNSILHHFLIPWGVTSAWISLFSGELKSVKDLRKLFLERRNQLKYEFYLPPTKDFLSKTLFIISSLIGRNIKTLDDCLKLSHHDLYLIASQLGVFSQSMNFIFESYYISSVAIGKLFDASPETGFNIENYLKKYKEIFEREKELGRIIKYPESYSLSLARSSLKYFQNVGYLRFDEGAYYATEHMPIGMASEYFEDILVKTLSLNFGHGA